MWIHFHTLKSQDIEKKKSNDEKRNLTRKNIQVYDSAYLLSIIIARRETLRALEQHPFFASFSSCYLHWSVSLHEKHHIIENQTAHSASLSMGKEAKNSTKIDAFRLKGKERGEKRSKTKQDSRHWERNSTDTRSIDFIAASSSACVTIQRTHNNSHG